MLIAHLPAGYLAARLADRAGRRRRFAVGIIVGAVLPDLDMLWFLLVDGGTVHHHAYLPDRPVVWVSVLALGLALRFGPVIGIGLGGLLHMALDTIAGAIAWGWPITDVPFTPVVVPARFDNWVLSFVFHWTFAVELVITAVAIGVFLSERHGQSRR